MLNNIHNNLRQEYDDYAKYIKMLKILLNSLTR